MIDDLLHVGTELDNIVAGIADEFAGDGDHALHQRHPLLNGIGNCLGGRGVAHHTANVGGQLAAGNLATHDLLDEHLFSALGVLGFSGANADVVVRRNLFFHQGDGVGLVVLNEDNALRRADGLHHGTQAEHDVVGKLQHDPMVGGQVRLALGAVDQHGVNGLAGLQLYVGGERRAAHAHDALLLDDLNDLVGGQLFQRLVGDDGLVERILAVVLDDDTQDAGAFVGMGMGFHRDDRAADAGMHGGADEARLLADELTHLHGVAGLNHRVRRCANVHGQGDDNGVGFGELLKRQMLRELLILRGMDAAVEALVPLGTRLGDVSLDLVHIGHGVIPQLDGLIQEFLGATLLFQTLVNLFPCAVLLGVNLALAVLRAAALAVDQALGAVHDGADAAGDVQIALGAGAAGLLRQGHAMMAGVIEGIGCRKHGNGFHIRHGLHAQAAGNDHHVLGAFGYNAGKFLLGLNLIAQKVHPRRAGNVLPLLLGNGRETGALRLFGRVELLEALVAGDNKEVILPRKQAFQLFLALQHILGIIHQISPSYRFVVRLYANDHHWIIPYAPYKCPAFSHLFSAISLISPLLVSIC